MSPPLERRARLRDCPELVRLIVAKFLEHDIRYQAGRWWWRARRRAEVFAGAWGEMLSSDVWTDEAHDAVVCETPERRKWWLVAPVVGFAALGPFVAMLPGAVQGVLVVMAIVGLISLVPTLRRELRRSKRHRPNAAVLTFLASRRPGAGRALLDARCDAADGRGAWLCLDAPEALEHWYAQSGFVTVGDPVLEPGRILVYMEREPRVRQELPSSR